MALNSLGGSNKRQQSDLQDPGRQRAIQVQMGAMSVGQSYSARNHDWLYSFKM